MLGWKQIAVFMDAAPESVAIARQAALLAQHHNAHLIGVFGVSRDDVAHPTDGFARGGAVSQVLERRRVQEAEKATAAGQKFADITRDLDVSAEFRVVWRDTFDTDVLGRLRSDLIVATHPKPRDLPDGWSAEHILLSNGGPVLLIPGDWTAGALSDHVLIAWNGSPKARRAVQDALPLLADAKRVTLLIVDAHRHPDRHGDTPGSEIQAYLERHGVRAEIHAVKSDGDPVAAVIVQQALELGASLTVLGAYSRSRTSEIIFGGVTRALLADVPQPLLIS